MPKQVNIFKTFEEQDAFHLEQMRSSTARERFKVLFEMQLLTQAFHKIKEYQRKIIIHNRYSKQ